MFLVSQREQIVRIGPTPIHFTAGERILTEYACKYELDAFANFVCKAGFRVEQTWTDPRRQFSVQFLLRERPVDHTAVRPG